MITKRDLIKIATLVAILCELLREALSRLPFGS